MVPHTHTIKKTLCMKKEIINQSATRRQENPSVRKGDEQSKHHTHTLAGRKHLLKEKRNCQLKCHTQIEKKRITTI